MVKTSSRTSREYCTGVRAMCLSPRVTESGNTRPPAQLNNSTTGGKNRIAMSATAKIHTEGTSRSSGSLTALPFWSMVRSDPCCFNR